jgi:manganese/zinc/iron transport system substrate-binding protein
LTNPPLILVGVLLALAAVAAGCGAVGEKRSEANADNAALRIATTTNFITDTVRQVGGDRVAVTGLMGPGVDPHLYKASAGDVRALREADAIFYGGLFLEGKMAEVLKELSEAVPTVAVSEAIPRERLLKPPAGAAPEEEFDPHVWFDPSLWRYAVLAVRDKLSELDPEGAAGYKANADRLLREMRELERYGREQIGSIPERSRVLVTSHDAFAYFGRAFDIDVLAIQGISTAAEATTADVDRVASVVARRGVKAVFIESSVPRQTIDAVIAAASKRGGSPRIGGELFSDAAGTDGTPEGTYVGMVRANIDAVTKGLR